MKFSLKTLNILLRMMAFLVFSIYIFYTSVLIKTKKYNTNMYYTKREITNIKSKLIVKNIKMFLPLRNRCVGLKFV